MKRTILLLIVLNLFLKCGLQAQTKQGQARIDSLLTELKNSKNELSDTTGVRLLLELSFANNNINQDEGIKYGKQALQVAEKLNWKNGISRSLLALAINYWGKSDYPKALEYNLKALRLDEEMGNKDGIALNLLGMGNVFSIQKDQKKALEYYLKSLKIFEELGDKKGISRNLNNIGIAYENLSDFTKALEYQFRSLKINKDLDNKPGMAGDFTNIGSSYYRQLNFGEANDYFLKSLRIYEELGDKSGVALTLGNIGSTYVEIVKDSNKTLLNNLFAGDTVKVLRLAKVYVDSSIVIFSEIGDQLSSLQMYSTLSTIQSKLGDHKSALESYKLFTALKDSVFNDANNKKLANLEEKRKEELREKELELAKAEEERKENIQLAGIGVFIIMLIGGLLLVSKKKIHPTIINILSTFSVLLIFELAALLLHPHITTLTHHNLVLTLICLVVVASIIVPLHHKAEHWMKKRLIHKDPIQIAELALAEEMAVKNPGDQRDAGTNEGDEKRES